MYQFAWKRDGCTAATSQIKLSWLLVKLNANLLLKPENNFLVQIGFFYWILKKLYVFNNASRKKFNFKGIMISKIFIYFLFNFNPDGQNSIF